MSKPCARAFWFCPADGIGLSAGTLEGEVVLPWCRCAEDSVAVIAARFEDFENMPGMGEDEDESDESVAQPKWKKPPTGVHCVEIIELALAGSRRADSREELMLALPVTRFAAKTAKACAPGAG